MKVFFLIATVLLLGGCNSIRKAQTDNRIRKAKDQILLHKDAFSSIVSSQFPCIPGIPGNDSAYEKSIIELTTYVDQLQESYDSLEAKFKGIDTVTVTLPGTTKFVDRIKIVKQKIQDIQPRIDTVRDSRNEDRLTFELSDLRKEYQTVATANVVYIGKYDWWKTACLITWGVLLLGLIIFFIIKFK